MKIKKETILDLTENFKPFVHSIRGSNYVVWIETRKFEYEGNIYFFLNNLREIFSDVIIDSKNYIEGKIIKSTFFLAEEEITKYLSWTAQRGGDISILKDQELIQVRTKIFWDLVQKNFDVKLITKVFKHQPQAGSYFDDFVMWGFCYVFLNEEDNTGIVLAAGAAD
jgi:hypothetical protein